MKPLHVSFTLAGLAGSLSSGAAIVLANQGLLSMNPTGAKVVAVAGAVSGVLAAFGHSVTGADGVTGSRP